VTEIELHETLLPVRPGDWDDEVVDVTAGWLRGFDSVHTRNAYRRDVAGFNAELEPAKLITPAWLPWCQAHGIDPLEAKRRHVAAYARQIEADGHSPGTRARKLSAVSSWYDYLIDEGILERNPAKRTGRPKIDRTVSQATGMSQSETDALLDQAEADSPLSAALISVLYFGGFRVGSVLGATIGDLRWEQGKRALRLKVKGGHDRLAVLEDEATAPLETYLETRGKPHPEEPLFVTAGATSFTEVQAWRLIRRLAREAGIKSWDQLNPHTLRHAHITHALDEEVPIEIVQLTAGHKATETTLRYDRARHTRGKRSGTVLSDRRREARAKRVDGGPAE